MSQLRTSEKSAVGQSYNTLSWPNFLSAMTFTSTSKSRDILTEIISEKNFPIVGLRDENIFVHNLVKFLIDDLHVLHGTPVLARSLHVLVNDIKNCHYFIKDELEQLLLKLAPPSTVLTE